MAATLVAIIFTVILTRVVGVPVGRRLGVDWQRRLWPLKTSLFSFFPLRRQKFFLAKDDRSAQKPWGRPLSRPRRPFLDPLAAILDF